VSAEPALKLLAVPFNSQAHMSFWCEVYADPEVRDNMYSGSTTPEGVLQRISGGHAFTVVTAAGTPVGTFTLHPVEGPGSLATAGFALHSDYRKQGLAAMMLTRLEEKAQQLGYRTLRFDIYTQNEKAIRAVGAAGFRPFTWFEKNIA
jgi:RimJ/RimL family protein N-acetyltransferase